MTQGSGAPDAGLSMGLADSLAREMVAAQGAVDTAALFQRAQQEFLSSPTNYLRTFAIFGCDPAEGGCVWCRQGRQGARRRQQRRRLGRLRQRALQGPAVPGPPDVWPPTQAPRTPAPLPPMNDQAQAWWGSMMWPATPRV